MFGTFNLRHASKNGSGELTTNACETGEENAFSTGGEAPHVMDAGVDQGLCTCQKARRLRKKTERNEPHYEGVEGGLQN